MATKMDRRQSLKLMLGIPGFATIQFTKLLDLITLNDRTARVAFGGDTLLGGYYNSRNYGTMLDLVETIEKLKSRDGISSVVDYFFKNIRHIFQDADYSVVNLEGPITRRLTAEDINSMFYPKEFPLRQHEDTADILECAGINLVSLANNHMFDFNGTEGLESTISSIEGKLDYVGAGVGENAYGYKIKNINDIRISFFGLTDVIEPESMVAADESLGVAAIPETKNYKNSQYLNKFLNKIYEAKRHSDYVVVLLHAGPVNGSELNERQIEISDMLLESGVDVIVGSHSHIKQPIKEVKDSTKSLKQLVFYGVGNLIFGGRKSPQNISIIPVVDFHISDTGFKHLTYTTYYIEPNSDGTFRPQIKNTP